jgi:hypothetical protein
LYVQTASKEWDAAVAAQALNALPIPDTPVSLAPPRAVPRRSSVKPEPPSVFRPPSPAVPAGPYRIAVLEPKAVPVQLPPSEEGALSSSPLIAPCPGAFHVSLPSPPFPPPPPPPLPPLPLSPLPSPPAAFVPAPRPLSPLASAFVPPPMHPEEGDRLDHWSAGERGAAQQQSSGNEGALVALLAVFADPERLRDYIREARSAFAAHAVSDFPQGCHPLPYPRSFGAVAGERCFLRHPYP